MIPPLRSPSPATRGFARPAPLRALYVDFNSYFASAEQQLRPELRGRPLGIAPVLTDSTCCIAASIEAKRFGVKTGTGVRDAKVLCPDIVIVEARPQEYIRLHHALVAAVESCLHVTAVRSIDEMWCELRGRDRQRANAEQLGRDIKQAIYQQVGEVLHCSIGIAPNRYLAKVASNFTKPNGLEVLESQDLPARLLSLQLRDLNGIGRSMEARLHDYEIYTVADLCRASPMRLRKAWGGVEGERMWAQLRGEWIPDPTSERSSVSHSHVLPPIYRSPEGVRAVADRLLQKAAMRLRHLGFVAERLSVRVKLGQRGRPRGHAASLRWGEEGKLAATSDTLSLLRALDALWHSYPRDAALVPLAVGVVLGDLRDAQGVTQSLFTGDHHALNQALDHINLRYGKNAVYFGGAHVALDHSAPRIAFTHIPDLSLEGGTLAEK